MSDTPRSSGRLALCAILLLCAGAGAWFYANDGALPWEKSPVQAVAEKNTVDAGTAEPRSEAPAANVETAHRVGGSLASGPEQARISPEEKMQARVDAALASSTALTGGDSAGGSLSQNAPQAAGESRDAVVTPHFVHDLAGWLATSYSPSSTEGKSGRSSVTLRSANARYSSSSALRSVESDVLKGRASILRYVYSPGMLEALYRMYGPHFLTELDAAAQARKSPLDKAQTADMFRVYADRLERVSNALEAASRVDIKALAAPIRRASAREDAANEAFSKAYTAHSEAREAGLRERMVAESERMTESARAASQADSRKERARRDAVWALRQKLDGPSLPDADLIFLVEWLARRDASPAATASAADICRRMAADMKSRASSLLAPAETAAP